MAPSASAKSCLVSASVDPYGGRGASRPGCEGPTTHPDFAAEQT
ncbi:hypothetical protein ACRJ4W_03810 [Streptomyces sp. GLT-R25]